MVHFTQQGADFQPLISGPTLVVDDPGAFAGFLVGTSIEFWLPFATDDFTGSTTYYFHDRLGDGTTLDFDGLITGVVSGSEIHGTMSGDMQVGASAVCRATDHVVTLHR